MTILLDRGGAPAHNILLYGGGGLGKSTLLSQASVYVWKKYGLKTRVVGADGGGTHAFDILIKKGILEYWPIDTWDEKSIFYYLDQATKGWWPTQVNVANSDLLPPTKEWRPCTKCGEDSGAIGLSMVAKCVACGEAFGAGIRLPKKVELVNGFDQVGLLGFEGLTAFGNLLMARLRKKDSAGGRTIQDDGFTISAAGQQHYGDSQTYIQQYVANTRTVPVFAILWTALELRGNDDGYGKPIYGPALPGKKLTAQCIPWFTDVFHVDGTPKAITAGSEVQLIDRKLYLAPHYPSDTKPYGFAAKTSAPLGGDMPLQLDFSPNGNTMERYFGELEKAYEKASAKLLG